MVVVVVMVACIIIHLITHTTPSSSRGIVVHPVRMAMVDRSNCLPLRLWYNYCSSSPCRSRTLLM